MFPLGSSYFVFVFLSLWCLWWEVWDNCIDSWSLPSFLFCLIWQVEPRWFHCLDRYLVSGMKCWTQVSSIVTQLNRNFSGSVSKMFRLASDIFCLVYLWLIVRSLGTQRAESFLIFRSSVRMKCTISWEIATELVMYLSVNRLWPITISWTLVTLSGVVTIRGPPEWGTTSRLSLPCLNSATILSFMVSYKVTFFLSIATITAWIALGASPFLCKYLLPCVQPFCLFQKIHVSCLP